MACFRWLWINYWVRDPALYYSAIHALKPKNPLKYFRICIYRYSTVQICSFLFFFLNVNKKGFSSCGKETKVRYMQLKKKLVAMRKLRHLWKWQTAALTRRLQIVISDAAPCQTSLKMAFTFHGQFSFLRWLSENIPNETTILDSNIKQALWGLCVLRRWIPSILIWEGLPNKDWSEHIHRTLHATWKP